MGLRFSVERVEPGVYKVTAFEGDAAVSWLYIIDVWLHYGASNVLAGGIAGVYTPREHRGKGFSAATLRYTIEWMREQGYPLSALFGIFEYYHRFGYATFMGEHTVTLSLRNASRVEAEELEWEVSEDQGYYRSEIAQLYESVNTRWPGARVRDPASWSGFRKGVSWEHPAKPLVVKEGGKLVAYAALERWPSPEELLIAEVGAEGHSASLYKSLLKILYKIALEERKSHIKVHLPPDHPFVRVARSYGCTVESFYPWSGGGMARVIRLKELLESIKGELQLRSLGVKGALTLRVGGEEATLKVNDGLVEVVEGCEADSILELDPGSAAQLILGFMGAEAVAADSEERRLLSTLFNRGEPYVWQPDRW